MRKSRLSQENLCKLVASEGELRPMSTALILIDIQKDYFPGGRMELVGSTEVDSIFFWDGLGDVLKKLIS